MGQDIKPIEGGINESFDFWTDSMEFIKTVIDTETFETKINDHVKARNFNSNEAKFFREMMKSAFDFHLMSAQLKRLK